MRPSVPDVHITDPQDEELSAYRAIAGQAVVGLLFGLLSPLAFLAPTLWAVPALGVLLCVLALRRIRRSEPALAGRKMAMAGLLLSLLFLTAAPTMWFQHRWRVRSEAAEFAASWFHFLTADEPQKAYQLLKPPAARPPLDDHLWAVYRDDPKLRKELENYVRRRKRDNLPTWCGRCWRWAPRPRCGSIKPSTRPPPIGRTRSCRFSPSPTRKKASGSRSSWPSRWRGRHWLTAPPTGA